MLGNIIKNIISTCTFTTGAIVEKKSLITPSAYHLFLMAGTFTTVREDLPADCEL